MVYRRLVGNKLGAGITRGSVNNLHPLHMVVSPLWHGPANVYGFVLNGRATEQAPTETAVLDMRVTTCSLFTIACGRGTFATNMTSNWMLFLTD